jgi:hypothetical protein
VASDDEARERLWSARDYVDRVIREMRADVAQAAALALAGEKDRIRTTLDALNHRLDELNNFKDALAAQTRDFPTREVVDEMMSSVNKRADERELRIRRLEQDKAGGDIVQNLAGRVAVVENFVSNLKGRITMLGATLLVLQGIAALVVYLLSRHH